MTQEQYIKVLTAFLIPAIMPHRFHPALFMLQLPHRLVEREHIPVGSVSPIRLWMDLVDHDVNVEVCLVIMSDDQVLVLGEAEVL